MGNAWKYIKWTAIGLTGTLLAVVVFLILWIDPNDYRDDVSKLVKDKTGLVLVIDGKIGWQFYPAIGFSVGGISLATGEGQPPLAKVNEAAVSVELMPLFMKQVNVRTLYVDGLVANLVVDENGKGNWTDLSKGEAAPEEPVKEETPAGGESVGIKIPKVMVTNTVVDYDDRKANSHYKATVRELVAENVGLQQEFPYHLLASVEDAKGMKVDVDTRAFLHLDTDAQVYKVRALEFNADIAGILAKPFKVAIGADINADMNAKKIGLSRLDFQAIDVPVTARPLTAKVSGPVLVDLGADTATVGPLAFDAAMVKGNLAVDVTGLTHELAFSGTLDVPAFNAKNAMREVGIKPPETTDPMAMTKVALKTAFEGALTRAMLNDIAITLDDTHVTGSAGVTDLATKAIVFDIKVDAINADRYLPPAAKPAAGAQAAATPAPAAASPAAGGMPAPLLPVDTLRTLNVDGKLGIGKVTMMDWPATDLAVGVKAQGGDIRIDPVAATVLEGTIRGDVHVDARGATPLIATNLKLNRIEVGTVVKRFAKKDLFTGKTSMNLALSTQGNDIDALIAHSNGGFDFTFADATLKGTNLNNLLTDALKQQLGAFSMLIPDYQSKLPKELQQDTQFSTLTAKANVKDGVAQVPAFNAAVKDGAVRGSGQFSLVSKDFDYTVAMRTDKLKDSKYFANAEFPLRCKGNIAGAPADWCRPDTKAMGDMLKKAAENAAKDRLKGELAKKLGVESLDTAALKAEAQKQLDAKAAEAKQQAEQKAKEELNKQLQKSLKKYF